jgi:antitoxin (DNA-binding transcriptional repressor) of toxin-antitoxin stability system
MGPHDAAHAGETILVAKDGKPVAAPVDAPCLSGSGAFRRVSTAFVSASRRDSVPTLQNLRSAPM